MSPVGIGTWSTDTAVVGRVRGLPLRKTPTTTSPTSSTATTAWVSDRGIDRGILDGCLDVAGFHVAAGQGGSGSRRSPPIRTESGSAAGLLPRRPAAVGVLPDPALDPLDIQFKRCAPDSRFAAGQQSAVRFGDFASGARGSAR
jgi:hypothetical protein